MVMIDYIMLLRAFPILMSKEDNALLHKGRFLFLNIEMVLLQPAQHQPQMLNVLLKSRAIHYYLIQVQTYHELVEVVVKGLNHQRAKRGWRISQPKRHDHKLKGTIPSKTCSLRLVPFCLLFALENSPTSSQGDEEGSRPRSIYLGKQVPSSQLLESRHALKQLLT